MDAFTNGCLQDCDIGYYMEGNFCLKCDDGRKALASDFNIFVLIAFSALIFFTPTFMVLGTLSSTQSLCRDVA